jgi:hypothetical protein
MPVLTPVSWYDNVGGFPVARIRKGLAEKMQKVLQVGTAQDLIYRDLEPGDIYNSAQAEYNNPVALTADTFAADVYAAPLATPTTQQAIGIFGIELLSPTTPALDIFTLGVGGATWGRFFLDILFGEVKRIGIFDPPLLWGPNQHITIGMESHVGALINTESFAILGVVAELDSAKVSTVPNANVGTTSAAGL